MNSSQPSMSARSDALELDADVSSMPATRARPAIRELRPEASPEVASDPWHRTWPGSERACPGPGRNPPGRLRHGGGQHPRLPARLRTGEPRHRALPQRCACWPCRTHRTWRHDRPSPAPSRLPCQRRRRPGTPCSTTMRPARAGTDCWRQRVARVPCTASRCAMAIGCARCWCSSGSPTLQRRPRRYVACEALGAMLGPALELKRVEQAARWRRRFQGRGRLAVLLGVLAIAVVVGGSEIDYRVSAPARVEGRVQRVVVAPFDGYVETASVRAGDRVQRGPGARHPATISAEARTRYRGRRARESWAKEYRRALASRDRAEARVLEARMAQAQARSTCSTPASSAPTSAHPSRASC